MENHQYISPQRLVDEEETKLLPELQRLCTDEELSAIEHSTYDLMTAEEMVDMLQVIFPHMNFSDKFAFLTDIKLAQPKKFQHLWEKPTKFLSMEEIERFQDAQSDTHSDHQKTENASQSNLNRRNSSIKL